MKIICKTLLMTMFAVTSACYAQQVKKEVENDLSREGLKSNVRTMTVTSYDFDTYDGEIEKEWEREVRTSYNRQGNMMEECQYYEDGSLSRKISVERDSLGKEIKQQLYFNWNGDLLGTAAYRYDDNGNLAEITMCDDKGKITDKKIYAYDNEGRRTEEKHLMLLNGSVMAEFVEKGEYKDGLLHKKVVYKDGEKLAEHRLTYNTAGENDEQISYDGDGKFRWRLVSQYNEQGDAYKWIQYSESGKVTVQGEGRFKYDSQGNAIKIRSYQDGELISEERRKIEYY